MESTVDTGWVDTGQTGAASAGEAVRAQLMNSAAYVLFVSSQSALVAGTAATPDGAVAVPVTDVETIRTEGEDT